MKAQRRNRKGVAGFSLLEALVALALTGMILSSLAMITAQWLPNWNRGFARVQGSETLALGLDRLISDMAAAEFVPAIRSRYIPCSKARSLCNLRSQRLCSKRRSRTCDRAYCREYCARDRALSGPRLFSCPLFATALSSLGLHLVVQCCALPILSCSRTPGDRIWKDAWQKAKSAADGYQGHRARCRDTTRCGRLDGYPGPCRGSAKCISAKSHDDCLASLEQPLQSAQGTNSRNDTVGLP